MTPPTVEPLQHTCPHCAAVLQYQASSGGLPFKCPTCRQVSQLPPPPRAEDGVLHQQFDEAADRLKKVAKERKRWRRVRVGLTVLYGCAWARLAVVSCGLLGFLIAWFGSLLGRSDTPQGPVLLGVIGLLLGTVDAVALVGYHICRQAPRSAGIHKWVQANSIVAGLCAFSCLASGILVLLSGFPPGEPAPRLAVGLAGTLFLAQWVLHILFLGKVAHAHCCVRLVRQSYHWLFLLAATLLACVILPPLWPLGRNAGLLGAGWVDAVMVCFLGLGAAVLTWLCVAWHVRLLHLLRLALPV
jgi:hypothetical protein